MEGKGNHMSKRQSKEAPEEQFFSVPSAVGPKHRHQDPKIFSPIFSTYIGRKDSEFGTVCL
eukprot:3801826-Ditylum_brightwellii.AAC.1